MRAQNQQDLIYKRGQAGITKASVTIVFDNSDRSTSPVGLENCKQITVTRQVSSRSSSILWWHRERCACMRRSSVVDIVGPLGLPGAARTQACRDMYYNQTAETRSRIHRDSRRSRVLEVVQDSKWRGSTTPYLPKPHIADGSLAFEGASSNAVLRTGAGHVPDCHCTVQPIPCSIS